MVRGSSSARSVCGSASSTASARSWMKGGYEFMAGALPQTLIPDSSASSLLVNECGVEDSEEV